MPYIPDTLRETLDDSIDELVIRIEENMDRGIASAGQINYIIASIMAQLTERRGKSYALFNNLIGALECCKLELYRRLAAPYEDQKILDNGDVF